VPFAYYERLSKKQRRLYDRSAAVTSVPLRHPERIRPFARALEAALATGKRRATQDAARALAGAILRDLDAPGLQVIVKATRPKSPRFELHGLYERDADGAATITVWMKTAAHARIVSFRTFLRTLLHEVLHHLDYVHFRFEDSLHTEGFYARESSLLRQVAPSAPPKKGANRGSKRPEQLSLFGD
jgi:hypothetical protein